MVLLGISRAIAGFEKTDGPDSPGVAAALDNLGQLYRDQEQFNLPRLNRCFKGRLPSAKRFLGQDILIQP
jgi:hypothetical protein